jgi:cysteine dioxygenase
MSSAIVETADHEEIERVKALRELTKTFSGIEKPLKNHKEVRTLRELIDELYVVFSSSVVNIEYVNHLMLSYQSNPSEWRKFAKFDRYRYTRNLVDAGNDKFNLMILCWGEGHASAIHDHADAHCFLKVLKGSLTETRYSWPRSETDPNNDSIKNGEPQIWNSFEEELEKYGENYQALTELGRSTAYENDVCYINDNIGLHRVENSSNTDVAVSLHLYCPPFNACNIFNQRTGKKTKCPVTFWSKFGERRGHDIPNIPEDK